MNVRHLALVIAVAAAVALAACGGSGASSVCLSDDANDAGNVCIVGSSGNLKVEASGLEPGSEFSSATEKTGEGAYVVPATGTIDGEVGFLGVLDGETIVVSGTWESGETFEGDVVISE